MTENQIDVRRAAAVAAGIIVRAETELRRELSPGERRDLLKDNTCWPSLIVDSVVDFLPRRLTIG